MNAGSLGGDRYVNFTLSGLVDIPSLVICYFLIKRYAVCKHVVPGPKWGNKVPIKSTVLICANFILVHACARFNTSTMDGGAPTKLYVHWLAQMSCILDYGTCRKSCSSCGPGGNEHCKASLCTHQPISDHPYKTSIPLLHLEVFLLVISLWDSPDYVFFTWAVQVGDGHTGDCWLLVALVVLLGYSCTGWVSTSPAVGCPLPHLIRGS